MKSACTSLKFFRLPNSAQKHLKSIINLIATICASVSTSNSVKTPRPGTIDHNITRTNS